MPRKTKAVAVETCDQDYDFSRLDNAVEKLADATSNLSSTLAGHTQRIDNIENVSSTLQEEVRVNRESHDTNFRHLNTRIDDVRRELSDKLDKHTETVTKHFDVTAELLTDSTKQVSERVTVLESWRWLLKGGLAVIALIATGLLARIFYVLIGPDVILVWFHKLVN